MGDRASVRTQVKLAPNRVEEENHCVFCDEAISAYGQSKWITSCGHSVCLACLEELSNGASKCPLDGTIVTRNSVRVASQRVDPNRSPSGQQREILFRCPNKDKCDKVLPLELIQEHLVKCLQAGQAKPSQPATIVQAVGPAVQQVKTNITQAVVMRNNPAGGGSKRRPLSMTSADVTMASVGEQRHQIEFLRDSILTVELRVDRLLQVLKDGMTGIQESSNVMKTQMSNKIEMVESQVKSFGEQMTQLTGQMKQISDSMMFKQNEIDVSYDGVLVWKVNGYSRLKATERTVDDLCSSPFYTNRHGYKMCLALDVMGDGIGRGSHISIYLCLMRGEYDNVLNWPFQQKVTFSLLDQKETRDKVHINRTLIPDYGWPEYSKPKTEKSIGRGFHRFVSHDVIESHDNSYLVNDCLYIKAVVDDSIIL